jgi:NDP-mannose synthase
VTITGSVPTVPPESRRQMPIRAVILAGGKGTRLGPYTTVLPKPLLPIGNKAILDVVVHQLRSYGITDMTFAVGYLAHLVQAVFGDGSAYDVNITYHQEDEPLGTVGALPELELDDTFLFMNGDVLTSLDYADLYERHRGDGNLLTIATHARVVRSEYGVLRLDESSVGRTQKVVDYDEKPEIPYVVSMGIYIAEPGVVDFIPRGERFDLPDLVLELLRNGQQVGSYLTDAYWLDIGRHDDYEQAIADFESLAPMLFGDELSTA